MANLQSLGVPLGQRASLYTDVLLAVIALILALGAPGPVAPHSILPPTQPGLSPSEGEFMVTTADDGSQALYFIAQNVRHSILPADVQTERQLNPLWPIVAAAKEDVLAFPEGAPIGSAKQDLIKPPAPPAVIQAPVTQQPEPAAAPSEQPETEAITYVLRPGDNLTHIARAHGTSVEAILAANGISNANRIYAGQALVIPSGDGAVDADVPAQDEPVADVQPGAPSADVQPGAASEDQPSTYTVARGDSAIGIARQFGISTDDLLAANGISNPNRVYVGQVLTVPAGSS